MKKVRFVAVALATLALAACSSNPTAPVGVLPGYNIGAGLVTSDSSIGPVEVLPGYNIGAGLRAGN